MLVADISKSNKNNLIRTSVPNLISGVSQQPDSFKLASQAITQENAISSVVSGLVKRPGTKWISNITYNANTTPLEYFWITKETTKYLGIIFNNTSTNIKSIRIFDINGVEQSVFEYQANQTITNYFNNADSLSIKSLTIADYTFLLNTKKIVLSSNSLTSRPVAGGIQVYQGIIVVKQGYTGRDQNNPSGKITWNYKIVGKDGTIYATATGNSGTGSSSASGGTDGFDEWKSLGIGGNTPVAIAKSISKPSNINIVAGTPFALGNYVIFSEGSNVYIQHESVDFDVITDDGYGQTLFYFVKDNVQSFTDLPSIAPHNFISKITGLPEDKGDEYYVKHISKSPNAYFNGTANSIPKGILGISDGVWKESICPNIKHKFNEDTMPHALIQIGPTTFLFTPLNGDNSKTYNSINFTNCPFWEERKVGDDDTNPFPSFLNKTINNIFLYKNRLGFLSNENIIFSEAGEFFNFFKTTISQILDSDCLDISSSNSELENLIYAIPFYDKLVLFSNKSQFLLQSDGELTSKSVSLQKSVSFEIQDLATPLALGTKIFVPFNSSLNYSGVYEFFINPNTILLDALDITANIPNYLQGKIKKLIASNSDSTIFTLSQSYENEIGIYKFFYNGDQKIQSAWSKFNFSGNIKTAEFFNEKIYFLIDRSNSISFESMDLNLNENNSFTTPSILIHLDRIANVSNPGVVQTGNIVENGTPITYYIYSLPYDLIGGPNSWSSGTETTSSGFFKSKASEVCVASSGVTYEVYRVYTQFSSGGTLIKNRIIVKSNLGSFNIGIPFTMKYLLNKPFIRTSAGSGQSIVADGRLQIRNGILVFANSRFFQIKVTPKYKDTYTYTYLYNFVPLYLGVGPTNLDYINLENGKFKFPVFTNSEELNVEIENSSPYGCSFTSLEWEALYSARSKRIG